MDTRALVLGGGGVTGVAWEIGLLAGLAEQGVDLAAADVIVGTSAGSYVGAGVAAGDSLEELYASQLGPADAEPAARMGPATMARFAWILLSTRNQARARARMGRFALAARTESEAARRAVFEQRLAGRPWPDRLKVTAVDARTGEFAVFDRAGPATLIDAVGASCAVPGIWPPVTIGERRFIDGGMRSAANADLAAIRAIGRNVLDSARREPAARAGRAQAAAVAARVREVWLGGADDARDAQAGAVEDPAG